VKQAEILKHAVVSATDSKVWKAISDLMRAFSFKASVEQCSQEESQLEFAQTYAHSGQLSLALKLTGRDSFLISSHYFMVALIF